MFHFGIYNWPVPVLFMNSGEKSKKPQLNKLYTYERAI